MTTKLDHPLRRELAIGGLPYTLTIAPDALHLVAKGRRKGLELRWADLVSGDAALATALNASLKLAPAPAPERNARTGTTAKLRGAKEPRAPRRPRAGTAPAKKRRSKAH